ncbi:MAG TPA: diol dehydratase small subunit [Solirubrobacteraceae bacterium]|nr:diol dehydratase small subunit [Solirubrobacteraceae bacterium]HUA72727.1 diol dehydratase small subunit [Solirubrobacteraceae bacterium]
MAELSYPLAASSRAQVRSASERPVDEITLDAAVSGGLRPADVAISADTLRLQAGFAERGGNPQLGENLRRAAELVSFGDDELLHFYEMLRPGRSSAAELDSLAAMLAERGAERCASLVREARDAYLRRGLIT